MKPQQRQFIAKETSKKRHLPTRATHLPVDPMEVTRVCAQLGADLSAANTTTQIIAVVDYDTTERDLLVADLRKWLDAIRAGVNRVEAAVARAPR